MNFQFQRVDDFVLNKSPVGFGLESFFLIVHRLTIFMAKWCLSQNCDLVYFCFLRHKPCPINFKFQKIAGLYTYEHRARTRMKKSLVWFWTGILLFNCS